MSEEKTIDQKSTLWNNKMAITFAISIMIGTNTLSVFVQQQQHNTEQIAYDEDANKRRIENAVEKLKLEIDVDVLKKELKLCNDAK
jgi:hypothetical protein